MVWREAEVPPSLDAPPRPGRLTPRIFSNQKRVTLSMLIKASTTSVFQRFSVPKFIVDHGELTVVDQGLAGEYAENH